MAWYALKTLLTAGIIVLVSEVAKQKAILGSLIASLPLVSVLGMLWLYGETQDAERLIKHSEGTFWYVIPSLPMFLLLPWLMRKGIGFYGALPRNGKGSHASRSTRSSQSPHRSRQHLPPPSQTRF